MIAKDRSDNAGNWVLIGHKNAEGDIVSYTYYAHLREPSSLEKDAAVTAGQVVGHIGKTGNADDPTIPPHLHFEIWTRRLPGSGLANRCDPVRAFAGMGTACAGAVLNAPQPPVPSPFERPQ